MIPKPLIAVVLLTLSNLFMTFAWYGHLKKPNMGLIAAIMVSWGVAFFEYCLQVPANRIGHGHWTAPQLKIIQEGIGFTIFALFSTLYLNENFTLSDGVAALLIFSGIGVSLYKLVG